METFKTIASLIFLGVGGVVIWLLLLGGGDGQIREEGYVRLKGSPQQAFEWIAHPDRREIWIDGLQSSRWVSGRAPKEGAELSETWTVDGRSVDVVVKITDMREGKLLILQTELEGLPLTYRYDIKAHNTGRQARVTYTMEGQVEGWWAKLTEPLIADRLFASVTADMERLAERELIF